MQQLTLPIIEKEVCVDDIKYHPEYLVPVVQRSLVELLDESGIFVFYRVDEEGLTSPSTTFSASVDWSNRHTKSNNLDVVKIAIEVGIYNLAKKIKDAYPNQDNVCMLYDSIQCAWQSIGESDQLTFSVSMVEEIDF